MKSITIILIGVILATPVVAEVVELRDAAGEQMLGLRVEGISTKAPGVITAQIAEQKALEFLETEGDRMGAVNPGRQLRHAETKIDDLGLAHVVFHQVHQGLAVLGGEVRVHLNGAGEVYLVNSKLAESLPSDVVPRVSEHNAREIAEAEARKTWQADTEAAIKGEVLILIPPHVLKHQNEVNTRLSWGFHVQFKKCVGGECFRFGSRVFVDAKTGEVSFELSDVRFLYREIYDCACFPDALYCHIDYPGNPPHIHGRSEGEPPRGPHNWPMMMQFGSTDVDSAYAMVGRLHSHIQSAYGIDGSNNQGGTGIFPNLPAHITRVFTHSEGPDGDWFDWCPHGARMSTTSGSISFCLGEVYQDLLGHEYGHTVTFHSFQDSSGNSIGTTLAGETGSLVESFCDIFGESFELSDTGTMDWLLGTGDPGGVPFRTIYDPPSTISPTTGQPHPTNFYDPNFYCGEEDYGGIHHNSTVVSYGLYLAAEGGTFNGCTFSPIGFGVIEQTFFRAWRTYFTRTVSFNEAYVGLIQACNDLYDGETCAELEKALQAVELDQPGLCSGIPAVTPACATPSAVEELPRVAGVGILSAHPNPFNPLTEIKFYGPKGMETKVSVYDIRGQRVSVLFIGQATGEGQSLTWNAEGHASGVYFVRVVCGEESVTEKIALLR
jgi:Zn-dependent metalloprotease